MYETTGKKLGWLKRGIALYQDSSDPLLDQDKYAASESMTFSRKPLFQEDVFPKNHFPERRFAEKI